MSTPLRPAPLLRTIVLRLATILAGVLVVLTVATVFRYTSNIERLRVASLRQQADNLMEAQRSGGPSRFATLCARYPTAYGYRIFDADNTIVSEANSTLFPLIPLIGRFRSGHPELIVSHGGLGKPEDDQWFITRPAAVGDRWLWVEVTMAGDPGRLWWGVLLDEIIQHVAVPAGIILPGLALAVLWSLRSILRPLTSIARQARDLAHEANSGMPLQPLRADGLPREAVDLVGAINVLLNKTEAMLDQQKQFATNAAHELRTHLAVLQLQISRLPPGEAAKKLRSDVAVMSRLVDQMLRLAQAEQLGAADFVSIDLREIGRTACEELALLAAAQGQFLEFDEAAAPVMVSCAPEFIGIAIRNIIENGLRATPVGTTVSVAIRSDGSIAVADCGPGIPEAERAQVFRRFWQRDRHNGQGAGIGLPLVHRIMDLHRGAIVIEDRNGGGARVVLSLAAGQ